jgi:hypothetical protein
MQFMEDFNQFRRILQLHIHRDIEEMDESMNRDKHSSLIGIVQIH